MLDTAGFSLKLYLDGMPSHTWLIALPNWRVTAGGSAFLPREVPPKENLLSNSD